MTRTNKILITIGAVVLLAAGIYFIWWLFIDEPPATIPQGGTLPRTGDGSASTSTRSGSAATFSTPRAISDHAAFDYWLVPETDEVYYLTPEGHVYAVKEGPDLEISRQTITALNRVEPSADGRRLLASFGNPTAPQWAIFDTVDSVWRPLAREVVNAGWGSSPNELVALVTAGGDINLSFVDISKTPHAYTVLIRNLQMKDVELSTTDTGGILLKERPTFQFPSRVWLLTPATRALALFFAPAPGLWTAYASALHESLFKFTPDLGTSLLYDLSTRSGEVRFPFFTFPDKCAVEGTELFCFVPKELTSRYAPTIPDSYLQTKFRLEDVLVVGTVATSTNSLENVRSPWGSAGNATYDASRVHVNLSTVYFLDRYTNLLHALDVK